MQKPLKRFVVTFLGPFCDNKGHYCAKNVYIPQKLQPFTTLPGVPSLSAGVNSINYSLNNDSWLTKTKLAFE